MPIQPGAALYTQGFGTRPEDVEVPHLDTRIPNSSDVAPIGKRWIDIGVGEYVNLAITSSPNGSSSNWALLGSVGGALNTLTGDTGGAITPVSNNITIAGTGSQIAVAGSAGTLTLSLVGPYTPTAYTAHSVILGEGSSSFGTAGPNAASGIPLISQGAAADPIFGTVVVAGGGTGAVSFTAHGVLVGEGTGPVVATAAGTNGQVLIGSTGADPAFGTLTTSTGLAFSGGANSLAVNVKQGGFAIDPASVGVPLVAQNAYTVNQAGLASFSLPATAAVGDRFVIASATGNTAGWIITQGAGQEIWANTSHTTNGVTGTLAGLIHTSVELMCVVANVEYIVMGGSGLTGLTFV